MTKPKSNSTNFANQQWLLGECPMRHTLTLLGGRWKLAILWQLSHQPMRFTTLHGHLAPISEKVLAGQLKELEKDGLLTRTVHAQVPPKVEYALTELGYSLQPVLTSLLAWGLHKQAFDRGQQASAPGSGVGNR